MKASNAVKWTHQVAVQVCGFDGVQRGNYFRGEPIWSTGMEWSGVKSRKGARKDEVTA